MSPIQRVAAAIVALLVIAAVAVLALGAAGAPIALGPSGRATATASPRGTAGPSSSADASAAPSTDEDDVLAALAEIEEQVATLRGLPPADIGPPDIITREALGAELERLFDAEYPPEDRERDNAVLIALGLLEPGEDVADLQLQLLGDQVLGFYDDVDRRMVVVSDAGLDAEAKLTYAHEYTHALQDAAFGLDSLETDALGEDDRALARTTLVEGDATVTMLAWALAHMSPEELMGLGAGIEVPDTTGVPSWMVDQLEFPYLAGQVWVGGLAVDPLAPDFTAVDDAWADPPDTTEQVVKPGAWDPREPAVPVEAPGLAAALGDGWEEIESTPVGQASIGFFLEFHGVAAADANAAARGWGGDRVVVASGPEDAFAVAWRLAWDTEADAAEFADAYGSIVDELPFPASVTRLGNGDILVAHASSAALLAETVAAAD